MEYVAPDLRNALRESILSKTMSIEDALPAIRKATAEFALNPLPEPSVEEVHISAPDGIPDVRAYVIGAKPGSTRPAILYMHGGGYILGTAKEEIADLQRLAIKHDCVIVTVDYRLAPETQFPGSLDDNYAALKWLFNNAFELGVDRSRIAVMGGSAGGGHAAMLAIAARNRGEVPIKMQLLIAPMLDDRTGSTVQTPPWVGQFVWTAERNRFGWSSLLGVPAGSPSMPEGAVPAREKNLRHLPPTFIGVGSIDLFVGESIEYAKRLLEAGVPTELLVVPGAFHGFTRFAPDSSTAKRFDAAVDAAITRAFGEPENL